MLISIIYQDDTHDLVKPFLLKELLAAGKVKKFLRSDGWAIVGVSPMRKDDSSYQVYEVERRTNPQ